MEPEKRIFEAAKRLAFLVDGFGFFRKLHQAASELDAVQAYFMRELEAIKKELWPMKDSEEFISKALKHLELAQQSLTHFNFDDAHFHTNSAHGFLSRLSLEIDMGSELNKFGDSTLWNGMTYGFGIAFVLYLAVFALVSFFVFFL